MTTCSDTLFHRDLNQEYPVMVRGEGIYLIDDQGRRYIDGIAGAGNVILGHGNKRIATAMAKQAETLAYCFSAFYTNQPALELSQRIADLAPGDLNCTYFVSGGSEGIETALKMARQFHLQQGNKQKVRVIGRWRGYHGATLGALSATGMPALREPFSPWLLPFHHISPCYPYRCNFAGCESACNYSCAHELEKAIIQLGPDNVAAFIGEPVVQGGIAGGVPPEEYYGIVRSICDKYNVLYIADEIITGFGRTGKPFAIQHWDIVPDILVFGKAASAGYCPLSGVIASEKIRDSFRSSNDTFAHVFTYVDSPVAMRVGLTVQEILQEQKIIEHAAETGRYLHELAEDKLSHHPTVGDVRGLGMLLGIELVKDRKTREPFPAAETIHKHVVKLMFERGLAASGTGGTVDFKNGDDLRLYPPLITTKDQIDEMLDIVDDSLNEIEKKLGVTTE